MSCSYADIAMAKYDSLANYFHLTPSVWKRFRDDIFVLWEHGTASLFSFLDYLNTMDKTGKIKFSMEIAGDTALEFLRRICDDEKKTFEKRSSEYQNYLIARDHKPSIVKKQFSEVKKKTRSEARQKQTKQDKVSDLKFITTYNPALPNIHNIIQNNLSILHTDENMKKIFPSKSVKTLYSGK